MVTRLVAAFPENLAKSEPVDLPLFTAPPQEATQRAPGSVPDPFQPHGPRTPGQSTMGDDPLENLEEFQRQERRKIACAPEIICVPGAKASDFGECMAKAASSKREADPPRIAPLELPAAPGAFEGIVPYYIAEDWQRADAMFRGGTTFTAGPYRILPYVHEASDSTLSAFRADAVYYYIAHNEAMGRDELIIGPNEMPLFLSHLDEARIMANVYYMFVPEGQPSGAFVDKARVGYYAVTKPGLDQEMRHWDRLNKNTLKDPGYWLDLLSSGLLTVAGGYAKGSGRAIAGERPPAGMELPPMGEPSATATKPEARPQPEATTTPGQTGEGVHSGKVGETAPGVVEPSRAPPKAGQPTGIPTPHQNAAMAEYTRGLAELREARVRYEALQNRVPPDPKVSNARENMIRKRDALRQLERRAADDVDSDLLGHLEPLIDDADILMTKGTPGTPTGTRVPCQAVRAVSPAKLGRDLPGADFADIEPAVGPPEHVEPPSGLQRPSDKATSHGRLTWRFPDGSKVLIDAPASQPGRPATANEFHAELHGPEEQRLDYQGIVVPPKSASAHPTITDKAGKIRQLFVKEAK